MEILHSSAGAISETDVTLASASNAIILGFNIRPEPKASALAEKEGVEIRLYTVIYEAINEIREAMEGCSRRPFREKSLGAPKCARPSTSQAARSRAPWWSTEKYRATGAPAWCATAASYGKAK